MKKNATFVQRFFQDKHGNVVIGQAPNVPIIAWAVLMVENLFMHNPHISMLASTVLFAWAYLEITEGVNNFRKTLGAVVLVGVVVGIFLR